MNTPARRRGVRARSAQAASTPQKASAAVQHAALDKGALGQTLPATAAATPLQTPPPSTHPRLPTVYTTACPPHFEEPESPRARELESPRARELEKLGDQCASLRAESEAPKGNRAPSCGGGCSEIGVLSGCAEPDCPAVTPENVVSSVNTMGLMARLCQHTDATKNVFAIATAAGEAIGDNIRRSVETGIVADETRLLENEAAIREAQLASANERVTNMTVVLRSATVAGNRLRHKRARLLRLLLCWVLRGWVARRRAKQSRASLLERPPLSSVQEVVRETLAALARSSNADLLRSSSATVSPSPNERPADTQHAFGLEVKEDRKMLTAMSGKCLALLDYVVDHSSSNLKKQDSFKWMRQRVCLFERFHASRSDDRLNPSIASEALPTIETLCESLRAEVGAQTSLIKCVVAMAAALEKSMSLALSDKSGKRLKLDNDDLELLSSVVEVATTKGGKDDASKLPAASESSFASERTSLLLANGKLESQLCVLRGKHSALSADHSALDRWYTELDLNYNHLEREHEELERKHLALSNDHCALMRSSSELKRKLCPPEREHEVLDGGSATSDRNMLALKEKMTTPELFETFCLNDGDKALPEEPCAGSSSASISTSDAPQTVIMSALCKAQYSAARTFDKLDSLLDFHKPQGPLAVPAIKSREAVLRFQKQNWKELLMGKQSDIGVSELLLSVEFLMDALFNVSASYYSEWDNSSFESSYFSICDDFWKHKSKIVKSRESCFSAAQKIERQHADAGGKGFRSIGAQAAATCETAMQLMQTKNFEVLGSNRSRISVRNRANVFACLSASMNECLLALDDSFQRQDKAFATLESYQARLASCELKLEHRARNLATVTGRHLREIDNLKDDHLREVSALRARLAAAESAQLSEESKSHVWRLNALRADANERVRAARADANALRADAETTEARLANCAPRCVCCGAYGARIAFKRCGHLSACVDCRRANRAPCCPVCAAKGQNFKEAFEVQW